MIPKVCVLLAAYNGAKYIKEQLDSILMQKGVLVDIYISLDLSTDATFEIVSEYELKHENIKLLDYGQRFGSAGKNFFHLICNVDFHAFDFISFADQDDIWLPHKLSVSIDFIQNSAADAYSGNVTAFWENGHKRLIKKDSPQVDFDYLFESAGPGCTFVLSQKLASDLKCVLNENYSEINRLWLHDWFCYSFARYNGYKWCIGNEPLMLYRQHDNNEVGASGGIVPLLSRAKVILSGDGFNKVIQQASFLHQKNVPIQLIKNGDPISLLKLALMGRQCRRKTSEKLLFSMALFLLALKKALKA